MKLLRFKCVNFVLVTLLSCFVSVSRCYSQNDKNIPYHFVYIARTEGDETNIEKNIERIDKLKKELSVKSNKVTTYLCGNRFTSNNLNDWDKLTAKISRWGSLSSIDGASEIVNILNIFDKNEFQQIENNTLKSTKYNDLTWHIFAGKGFWESGYNQSIFGVLIAAANLSDKYGVPFQIKFYFDNDEKIVVNRQTILGGYFSFLTENNVEIITY